MSKKPPSAATVRLRAHRANPPDLDEVAAQALAFLAADPERMGRFFAVTGLDAVTLRVAARDPGFSLAVLTHFNDDERLLVAFAQDAGLDPEAVGRLVRGRIEREAWRDP